MSKNSTFKEKSNDPGFLVALGRFRAPSEPNLQELIRSGVRTDDPRIVELKQSVDAERRQLEKDHVKKLANAIGRSIENNGYATIRCVGRDSVYNACKAMAIARGNCYAKGIDIKFSPSFDQGNLGELRNRTHVKDVTALVFTLSGFNTLDPTGEN